MATGQVTIRVFPDAAARDAVLGWDEGDLAYVIGTGLTIYGSDAAWHVLATLDDLP